MTSIDAAQAALATVDVAAERARTRGVAVSHHLNSAGSALPTAAVVDVVVDHLRLEERIGGYEAAAHVIDRLDAVYDSAAGLIGAASDEIALFDSASTALRTYLDALIPGAARRVLASTTTYVSHAMHLMRLAERYGIEVEVIPADANGRMDLAALDARLADGMPTIVTVSHIPTSSGLVEPVVEIGEIARRHGAVYLLDATQSVGHVAVDVKRIGCDALATTGRKFLRAPRGTGFGYLRRGLMETVVPAAPDVRGAEWRGAHEWQVKANGRRYESWESAVAARLGLGVALDEALERGMHATESWLCSRADHVRAELSLIPGVTIADPPGAASAIITFTLAGMSPSAVVAGLREADVQVVQVPASHGQWDIGARGISAVVRASLHVYNDENDESGLIHGVRALAASGGTA